MQESVNEPAKGGEATDTRGDGWRLTRGRQGFPIEYALIALLAGVFASYILGIFIFGLDFESLKDWGYLGVFFIAMAGSATIILPTPARSRSLAVPSSSIRFWVCQRHWLWAWSPA